MRTPPALIGVLSPTANGGGAGVAAAAVMAAALLLAAAAGWDNFATADEPYHLLAAWTYVAEGEADFNPEHPPLTKLVAGLALLPLELNGAKGDPVQRLPALSWEVRRFLHHNSAPAEAILRSGRLAMLPFLALLLAGVYRWGRELAGPGPGLLALTAVAAQPLVLGHAFVVHTDVASAATWVWALRAAHAYLRHGGRGWVGLGGWLGVALLVKFSAVYLVLGVALAVSLAAWRRRAPELFGGLVGAGVLAAAALPVGYAPLVRHASPAEVAATWSAYLRGDQQAHERALQVARLPLVGKALVQWGTGLAYVARTNRLGQGINYFFGRTSTTGFWLYFPVVLVLKVSLPFLLLVFAGGGSAARRRGGETLAPVAGAAFYLLISMPSSYNIGARHLLPVVALLGVAAAAATAAWRRGTRLAAAAALAAAPILAFPHYISHFNEIFGAERGARWLADSNVDWGQDWYRAARLAVQRGWQPITVVYLGSADPAAEFAGGVDFFAAAARPATPYVAISRHAAAVGVEYLAALGERAASQTLAAFLAEVERRGERLAVIGHSLELYRLAGSSTACSPAARRLRMSQESSLD